MVRTLIATVFGLMVIHGQQFCSYRRWGYGGRHAHRPDHRIQSRHRLLNLPGNMRNAVGRLSPPAATRTRQMTCKPWPEPMTI